MFKTTVCYRYYERLVNKVFFYRLSLYPNYLLRWGSQVGGEFHNNYLIEHVENQWRKVPGRYPYKYLEKKVYDNTFFI